MKITTWYKLYLNPLEEISWREKWLSHLSFVLKSERYMSLITAFLKSKIYPLAKKNGLGIARYVQVTYNNTLYEVWYQPYRNGKTVTFFKWQTETNSENERN